MAVFSWVLGAIASLFAGCWLLPLALAIVLKFVLRKANVVDNQAAIRIGIDMQLRWRLEVRTIQLSPKLLSIINTSWAAALPLVMTHATVHTLFLELNIAELLQQKLPCVVLEGVEARAHITHQNDWSVSAEIRRYIERKHAMANYLTKILSSTAPDAPKVSRISAVIDWLINNARLSLQRVHVRIEDPKLGHAMGLQLTELNISPGVANEETLWEVPRMVLMRDFAFYVDLHGHFVDTQAGHNYMLRFSKVEVCIEFPDILGVMIQPGKMPFGRGKRMRIFGDFYNARPVVHQIQMPTFLFELLKAFGPFEYLPWKAQIARQLDDNLQGIDDIDANAYICFCRAAAGEQTAAVLAEMKAIETRLSLSQIMSLRRQAHSWTFEAPPLDATRDSLLPYSSAEVDDDAMSAKLAQLRPLWDSDRFSLRELDYAPLRFHQFDAALVACTPDTPEGIQHNSLTIEHLDAFCRILLARDEFGTVAGATDAVEPGVKFLETGGSLRQPMLTDTRSTFNGPSPGLLLPSRHSQNEGDGLAQISGSYKLDSDWNQFVEGELSSCTIAGGSLKPILEMIWVIVASFRRGELGGNVQAPDLDIEKLWAITSAELLGKLSDPSFTPTKEAHLSMAEPNVDDSQSQALGTTCSVDANSSLLLRGLKMNIDASLVDVDVILYPDSDPPSQFQALQLTGRFFLDSKQLQELMTINLDKLVLRSAIWRNQYGHPRGNQHARHQQGHVTHDWRDLKMKQRVLLDCQSISATLASSASSNFSAIVDPTTSTGQHGNRSRRMSAAEKRVCVSVDYGSFIDIPETIDGLVGLRRPFVVVRIGNQERRIFAANQDTLAPQFSQQAEFYFLLRAIEPKDAESTTQLSFPAKACIELYDEAPTGIAHLGSGTISLAPETLESWTNLPIVSASSDHLGDLVVKAEVTDPVIAVEVQSVSLLSTLARKSHFATGFARLHDHGDNNNQLFLTVAIVTTTSRNADHTSREVPSVINSPRSTFQPRPFTQRTNLFSALENVSLSDVLYFPAAPNSEYLIELKLFSHEGTSTRELGAARLRFNGVGALSVPVALRNTHTHVVAEVSVGIDWARTDGAALPRRLRAHEFQFSQSKAPNSSTAGAQPDDSDDGASVHSELTSTGAEGSGHHRANSLDWMDAFFEDAQHDDYMPTRMDNDAVTLRRHINLHARGVELEFSERDLLLVHGSLCALLRAVQPPPSPDSTSMAGNAIATHEAASSRAWRNPTTNNAPSKHNHAAVIEQLLHTHNLSQDDAIRKHTVDALLGELQTIGNLTSDEWQELAAGVACEMEAAEPLKAVQFVQLLCAVLQRLNFPQTESATAGNVVLRCRELCDPLWPATLLGTFSNLRHAVASSVGGAVVQRAWTAVERLVGVSRYEAPRISAKLFQAKLLRALKHFGLARDIWRHIIVPTYFQLPQCFDIRTEGDAQCLPMAAPVTEGSRVFLDHDCTILSFPLVLQERLLSGICTYKFAKPATASLFGFFVSRPSLVYVCVDNRCDVAAEWATSHGFTAIDGTIGTNDGEYVVFGKLVDAAGPVHLGKWPASRNRRCNFFVLLQAAMDANDAQSPPPCLELRWLLHGDWLLAKSALSDGLEVVQSHQEASTKPGTCGSENAAERVRSSKSIRQCVMIGADISNVTARLFDPVQSVSPLQLTLDVFSAQLMLARMLHTNSRQLLNYEDTAKGHVDLGMRAQFYNHLLQAHESFLEPCDLRLQFSKLPNTMATFCSIDTSRRFVFNVTAQLHEQLLHATEVVQRWTTAPDQLAQSRSEVEDTNEMDDDETWSSVVIRNSVGEPILVEVKNAVSSGGGSQSLLILPNESVEIHCPPDRLDCAPPQWSLSVTLPATGLVPLKNVLIGAIGEHIYPIHIADMLKTATTQQLSQSSHPNHVQSALIEFQRTYKQALLHLQRADNLSHTQFIEPLALVLETRLFSVIPDAPQALSRDNSLVDDLLASRLALELHVRTNVCIENQCAESLLFKTDLSDTLEQGTAQRVEPSGVLPVPLHQLVRQKVPFTRLRTHGTPEALSLSLTVLNPLLAPALRRPKELMDKSIAVRVNSTRDALSTVQTSAFELEATVSGDSEVDNTAVLETDTFEASKRSVRSRLGSLFARPTPPVAAAVVPVADWSLVFLPSYEVTNTLPCSVEVHIDQPAQPTKLGRNAHKKQDGARDLFFLPDQFYIRDGNGNPIIAAAQEADDGEWVPFEAGTYQIVQVTPGASVVLHGIQLDRTLALRVKMPGANLLSECMTIAADVHNARLAFQKHRAQAIRWKFSHKVDWHERTGAPQLRVKREWAQQGTRTLVLFCSFWIANKTGMALRYRTFSKHPESVPNGEATNDKPAPQSSTKWVIDHMTADSVYQNVFCDHAAALPIMLDCPTKRLSVLPYAMTSEREPFYVYDLKVKSSRPYRCHDDFKVGDILRTDVDAKFNALPSCFTSRKLLCIQTPFADPEAQTTDVAFITFVLPSNAIVYVGLVVNASTGIPPQPLPWMQIEGFQPVQGSAITVSTATSELPASLRLFYRFYASGSRVALGGTAINVLESSALGAPTQQMYTVIVGSTRADEVEPSATGLQIQRNLTDSVLCRAQYAWQPRFSPGTKPYVDRDYTIDSLPHPLDKMPLLGLRTAQGDKRSTSEGLVTFRLTQASEVLLCLDSRARHPPLWLKSVGFLKLGLSIPGATEGYHYEVYSKTYESGVVSLDGNGRVGAKRNYFVLIALLQDFLQWMPRETGVEGVVQATESVLQTITGDNSIHDVWDTTSHGELSSLVPPLAALGRSWSDRIDMKAGNVGELVTSCSVFGVKVVPLSGLLHRTTMVTLLPRFVLVNQLGVAIEVSAQTVLVSGDGDAVGAHQNDDDACELLGANKSTAIVEQGTSCILYHFPSARACATKSARKKLERRAILLQRCDGSAHPHVESADDASQPIFVEEMGQQFVWLRRSGSADIAVCATISVENPIVFIVLQDVTASPPYRLENRSSSTTLRYKQSAQAARWDTLPPLSWRSYVHESSTSDRYLFVTAEGFESQPQQIVLDSIGQSESLVWKTPSGFGRLFAELVSESRESKGDEDRSSKLEQLPDVRLTVRVVVEGRSRVVQFHDLAPDDVPSTEVVQVKKSNSLFDHMQCELRVMGVDVSIVDSAPGSSVELLSCSVEGILIRVDTQTQLLNLSVYHVQVDDHRACARFPVVFGPLDSGFNSHLRDEQQEVPMLRFRARRQEGSLAYLHLTEFEFVMQEMVLKLDMQFLLQLVAFIGKFAPELDATRAVDDVILNAAAQDLMFRASKPNTATREILVFLEMFHHSSLLLHTEIFVGQRVLDFDPSTMEGSIADGFLLLGAPVLSSVSAIVSSVAHTNPTFVFNELVVENFFGQPSKLLKALQLSFTQQAIAQSYKLFGSMEVLGDPLSLVGNLGTGVMEFFRRTGAEMIGDAETKGAGVRQLLKGVVGGTFSSASKISGSLADMVQGVTGATALERRLSSRPVDLQSGFRQGGEVFVDSLKSGLNGVVSEPRRGLDEAGMIGAVGGVFRGVIGLATAPIVGSLGAVARVSEGVDAFANFYHGRPMGRRRAAKQFDPTSGIILPPAHGVWEENLPARFTVDGRGPFVLHVPAFVPSRKLRSAHHSWVEETQFTGTPRALERLAPASDSSGDDDQDDEDEDLDDDDGNP